jgi:cytochrome b561
MTVTSPEKTAARKSVRARLTSAFQQLMSLHWAMSWCYFTLFATGYVMTHWVPEDTLAQGKAYDFHKGLGAFMLALVTWRVFLLLRVWWKKYTRQLPKFSLAWWSKTSLHALLYLFMWAVPLTGFFLSNSYQPNNVKFMGLVLPDLFPQNNAILGLARNMHFWFAYAFLAFVVLHMIAQRKVVRSIGRRWAQVMFKRPSAV